MWLTVASWGIKDAETWEGWAVDWVQLLSRLRAGQYGIKAGNKAILRMYSTTLWKPHPYHRAFRSKMKQTTLCRNIASDTLLYKCPSTTVVSCQGVVMQRDNQTMATSPLCNGCRLSGGSHHAENAERTLNVLAGILKFQSTNPLTTINRCKGVKFP